MKKRMSWWICLGMAGGALGCCPIPIPRTVEVRPLGRVEVVAAAGEQPVAGASVLLAREEAAPHPREGAVERWGAQADAKGVARFTKEERREWSYPLMMHGVTFYKWRICAQAPGMQAQVAEWPNEATSIKIALEAAGEDGASCEELLPMSPNLDR
jgi:hypothetical protein